MRIGTDNPLPLTRVIHDLTEALAERVAALVSARLVVAPAAAGAAQRGAAAAGDPPADRPLGDLADQAAERLLSVREVSRYVGLAQSTLWGKARTGSFPKPVKLGRRATRWRLGDVRDWLAAQSG